MSIQVEAYGISVSTDTDQLENPELVFLALRAFSENATEIRLLSSLMESSEPIVSDAIRTYLLAHASLVWRMILDDSSPGDVLFSTWKQSQIEKRKRAMLNTWQELLVGLFIDADGRTDAELNDIREKLLQNAQFLEDLDLVGVAIPD